MPYLQSEKFLSDIALCRGNFIVKDNKRSIYHVYLVDKTQPRWSTVNPHDNHKNLQQNCREAFY